MDIKYENVWLPRPVDNGIPMRADFLKLESHSGASVSGGRDGEFQVFREKLRLRKPFPGSDITEYTDGFAALVAEKILVPGNTRTAIRAEEMVPNSWEMGQAKLVVVFGEMCWCERFVVRLSLTVDAAGAPTRV